VRLHRAAAVLCDVSPVFVIFSHQHAAWQLAAAHSHASSHLSTLRPHACLVVGAARWAFCGTLST
jgi:hypothetical protein